MFVTDALSLDDTVALGDDVDDGVEVWVEVAVMDGVTS